MAKTKLKAFDAACQPKAFAQQIKQIFAGVLRIACLVTMSNETLAEDLTGNVAAGGEVYNAVCSGCHNVSIAPTLRGIIDRPAANLASFAGYSEALKAKKDLIWTKENLNKFLINPQIFVPGTLMVQEIPEAQKRADIIAFLATLPPPRR